MNEEFRRQVSTYIKPEEYEQLKEKALELKISMSQLIYRALISFGDED